MKNKVSYPVRRVFIIDEIALIVSMALALFLRFRREAVFWHEIYEGLYVYIIVTVCIFHVIIYLLYDNMRPSIFKQDPFENLVTVVKSRLILALLSLIYLYVAQRSLLASRAVMGMFFVFSIVLGFTLRMLYRRYHIRKYGDGSRPNTLMLHTPFPDEHGLDTMFREGEFDDVMVLTRGASRQEIEDVIDYAERLGIRTYCSLNALSYDVHSGIVTEVAHRASIPAFVRKDKFRLFGVNYSVARVEEAVLHVMRHLDELKGHYICFSNVHTTVMARESREYAEVLNGAAFTFPDGTPIAKIQKKKGLIGADRVAGPDFMMHMFRDTTDGKITHFFYGSTQETLDALKVHLETKYPGIIIKGMYSPPFRELTEEEDRADVEMINDSGADIIWIGLGAPKQEKWMRAHEGKINGVMMGVGAGFDFHAGTIKRAPEWIQKIGFEWLYRLFQDPERLIKRYFVTNIKFLWYLAGEIIRNGF